MNNNGKPTRGTAPPRSYVNPDGTVSKPKPNAAVLRPVPPSAKARNVFGGDNSYVRNPAPARRVPSPAPMRNAPPAPRQIPPQGARAQTGSAGHAGQQRSAQHPPRPTERGAARPAQPQAQRPARPPRKEPPLQNTRLRQGQNQSSRQAPPYNAQQGQKLRRPPVKQPSQNAQTRKASPRPDRQRSSGWAMPENSPVYTSRGTYYERPYSVYDEIDRPERKRIRRKKHPSGWYGMMVRGFFLRLGVIFLITCIIGSLWYYNSFWKKPGDKASTAVTYTFGEDKSVKAGASSAYSGGVLYADFTTLSAWLGISTVGSIGALRYVIPSDTAAGSAGNGSEEFAVFTEGSGTAIVNGTSMTMEAEARIIDADVWVPVSFIKNYISGITVEVGDKGDSVTVTAGNGDTEDKDSDSTEKSDLTLSFRLKQSDPIASVVYSE